MMKFIITTTINSPTEATHKFIEIAKRDNWIFVVVGDTKTPHEEYEKIGCIYLHPDWAEGRVTVYDGDELWGHLDLERDQIESHIDYYISICPDMWFHEHLLFYLIEAAKQCKDKYFVITPEIYKLWDATWDELVHDAYQSIPYEQWNQSDIFEIQRRAETLETPFAQQTDRYKWAGWFDIYSKALVEELIPIPAEWKGYGPWDFFGMIVSDIANKNGTPVKEYVLKNQIIFEYHPDKNDKSNFADYYKDMLVLNKIENQRQVS